jgi:dihydrofolate synthase/folylpolyglutamate synthase
VTSEVAALIKQVAEENRSPSYFLGADFKFFLKNERFFDYKGIQHHFSDLTVTLHGRHQRSNAAIAIAALELAGGSFPVSEEAIRRGLSSVVWPGRFEIVRERPWVILDGAHNGEGASALAEVLKEFRRGRRIKLLFAAMEDKDWHAMLSLLLPLVDEVMVTRVRMERSAEPGRIARWAARSLPHRIAEEAGAGLKVLFQEAGPDDIILVAGSLYLLGEVRPTAQDLAARRESRN